MEDRAVITLDERGTVCPITLFHVKMRMEALGDGNVLMVLFTDSLSKTTIPQWAELQGHRVLAFNERDGYFEILLEKGRG